MKNLKTENSAKQYCQGGKSVHFADILEYSYNIDFDAKPDYKQIKFMLKKILLDMDHIPHKMFNWKKKSAYALQNIPSISEKQFDDIQKLTRS